MKLPSSSYRILDLSLLSLLAVVCEVTSNYLHTQFNNSGFYMSFSYLIVLIALVRWKERGVIVNIALVIPLLYYSSTLTWGLPFYYLLTSSSVILVPFFVGKIERVIKRESFLLYGLTYYFLILVSRGMFSFLIGLSMQQALHQTLLQMNFSLLMSSLVLLLLKNTEGLLVDFTQINNMNKEVVKGWTLDK